MFWGERCSLFHLIGRFFMNSLEQKIYDLSLPICTDLGVELVSVEWVRENGMQILRLIIDKKEGISIDDTTSVSEKASEMLDEVDPIPNEYYLEVSSVGIEKELKTKEEITASIGKYVAVKTYEKIKVGNAAIKEFEGHILNFDGEILTLKAKIKQFTKEVQIPYNLIAKIRLAIEF